MNCKKVIFTVDTEGHIGVDPVSHLILGRDEQNRLCGIDLIMDICDEYRVKGLFFVDIAEAWDYGKDKIAYILLHIKKRGHDIGVHIHPDHMADAERVFLSDYSYDEQYEMIKKCTELYEEILGEHPLAFRAGKYGADHDTLNILSKLGYKMDFSEFIGQKWCHIHPPAAFLKGQLLESGLVEIPVTSYQSFRIGSYFRNDKVDVNMPLSEFKYIMRKIAKVETVNPVVLFAHSFSLLSWRLNPDHPRKINSNEKKVRHMFSYIDNSRDFKFVTLNELLNEKYNKRIDDTSIEVKGISAILFFSIRALKVLKMKAEIKIRDKFKNRD